MCYKKEYFWQPCMLLVFSQRDLTTLGRFNSGQARDMVDIVDLRMEVFCLSSRLSSKCVVASLCCNRSQKNQILFPEHKKQLRRMFLVFFCVVSVGAGALRLFVVSTAVFWLRVVKKSSPIFVETWLFRLRYGRRFLSFLEVMHGPVPHVGICSGCRPR